MSPLIVLAIVVVVGTLAVTGVSVVASIKSGARRKSVELKAERRKVAKYEKTLRAIANGAGSPALEAQLVLDTTNELES